MAKSNYLIHPKHPLRTIVYIVLALGLVVGGYFTFKASQSSTEGRSKAAQEGKVFARWEFNGPTTEGWDHEGFQSLTVSKGKMKAVMSDTPETSYVFKNNINVKMDRGNKKLSLRMAVGSAQVLPPNDGPTPTYILLDEAEGSDLGEVDCVVASSGLTVCSTNGGGTVVQPGQSESGRGSGFVNPESDTSILPTNPSGCVIRPTCKQGDDCLVPLLEPRGGWCPDATPTSSCTPCNDPRGFCPLEEYGAEPPGGWCPPNPPCQPRPSCLDAKPACKILEPPGGWCPAGGFTFDVMYAYEEEPTGGDQGMGPVGSRRVEKVIQLKGLANGKLTTYNLTLPEIQAIKIVDLKITFASGVNQGGTIVFDWIRLNGAKIKGRFVPTVKPTGKIKARFDQCGKRCADDSDCGEEFTCILPLTVQCEGADCNTRPVKKVCAYAQARNAKGYSCKAGKK